MRLKDDIYYLQQELGDIKQESFAMEMLKDYKKQNQRLFVIVILILIILALTFGYLVYILNDIQVEEITTEDYDVSQESGDNGNNNIINGNEDNINNG